MTTIKRIAELTQAQLTGDDTRVVTDVSHDSRRTGEGALFVAVSGALFDAHKFISQVMAQGAAGVLSEKPAPADFNGAWRAWQQHLPEQFLPFSAIEVPALGVPDALVMLDLWVYVPQGD